MSNQILKHLVLAIESSCDETSLCLLGVPNLFNHSSKQKNSLKTNLVGTVESDLEVIKNTKILSSVISSQIKTHQKYGGVVPEVGARMHAQQIHFIWTEMLDLLDKEELRPFYSKFLELNPKSQIQKLDTQTQVLVLLDKIMVTTNPGLASALRVGQEFAKTIKYFATLSKKKYSQNPTASLDELEIMDINHLRGHMASSFY